MDNRPQPDLHPSLVDQAYDQLRAVAARCLAEQAAHHTLQPTALVHEAWLRLRNDLADFADDDRARFVAGIATAMRHVLVDHARRKNAVKRGGGWERVTLADATAPTEVVESVDAIALDEAIDGLAQTDAELARLAELRLFGGLSVAQAGAVLDWPLSTTKKRWKCTVALLSVSLG